MKLPENIKIPKKMFRAISAVAVDAYLRKNGWKIVNIFDGVFSIYKNDSSAHELSLVINPAHKRYTEYISTLIFQLHKIEGRGCLSIMAEIEEMGNGDKKGI